MRPPRDRNGNVVKVGARVRLLSLSGAWLDELPPAEKGEALSMIGEVFDVYDIDEYGQPWILKAWRAERNGETKSHSVAPAPCEIEIVEH